MSKLQVRRGDVVLYAAAGDYGKPRPGVIVQSDLFNETHASVTVCPLTSDVTGLRLFRVPMGPGEGTGLKSSSEAMVDKVVSIRRERIARKAGVLGRGDLAAIDEALRLWLGLD